MTVKVRIPTALRAYAGGQATVEIEGVRSVGEALEKLTAGHPALRQHLFDERGTLRAFVNLYLNQTDVRELGKQETPVKSGDTLMIVPSVAGGGAA